MCHDNDLRTEVSSRDDPVNFHLWLLKYIKEQKMAFTADLALGAEVWFYPIYRYDMTSLRNGITESVEVKIYYADDNVVPDYTGTIEKEKIYKYNLMLNTYGEIIDGEWTDESINDHPEVLSFPLSSAARCPYLDCQEVRRIAKAKDDDLEPWHDGAVEIFPGTYHLVLLNKDQYTIDGVVGDCAYVKVVKETGSHENIDIKISDNADVQMFVETLDTETSTTYQLVIQNPPYTITLTQGDYSDPNIYSLTVDMLKTYGQNVPYIPKDGQWSGFALTNAGENIVEDVSLVTFTHDGSPLQTVFGPVNLSQGEKRIFMFEDLLWRPHEYQDTRFLKLLSDQPVNMVNLFAGDQKPMAGFVQGEARGTHLVLPDTVKQLMTSRKMFGAVFNETFNDATVTMSLYSASGELQYEVSEVLSPGGRLPISPGGIPFAQTPDGGWIDIVASELTQLSAYQYVQNQDGDRNAIEALFALPVETNSKIVPHITPLMGWWRTYMTLINPNDAVNHINLHLFRAQDNPEGDMDLEFEPYEKRVIDLSAQYGGAGGNTFSWSILEVCGQLPIVGYYTYSPPYGYDEASFPLMDQSMFKSDLVLPHYAGQGGYFWTGICICNPNADSVSVKIQPYDNKGEMDEGSVTTISLDAGAYEVFTIRSLFGETVSKEIAFITFQAQEPIGGFYLFGNMKDGKPGVEMLCGANM